MPLLLLGCGEQKNDTSSTERNIQKVEIVKEQSNAFTDSEGKNLDSKNVIERFLPKEKETLEFDTLVSAENIEILIKSRSLDSYVTNEFEIEGIKHFDKYRDSEKHLIIKKSNKVVIDTVFKKSDFTELTGEDFLKIANFHGYWFNKIGNDTIELFGVISKPETDWSVAFYHFLDLKSMTFELREYIDEEM